MKSIFSVITILLFLISCKENENKITSKFKPTDTVIVLVKDYISDIKTDVKYATADNFTGKILYQNDKVYVRKIVCDSLKKVQEELKLKGFSLKIYDAYRPLSVQKIMWQILPDTNYVADPAKGSRHNRGAAIDLTIVDSNGIELDMGTKYDDFTERARPDYFDLSDTIKANRALLKEMMTKRGFTQYKTEWWHFDFNGWENFAIIDIK